MVKRKLANGKVIIKDQYGIYSYMTKGIKKFALVGCENLTMNYCERRDFMVMINNGTSITSIKDITKAEVKSIIRHKRSLNIVSYIRNTYPDEGWQVVNL